MFWNSSYETNVVLCFSLSDTQQPCNVSFFALACQVVQRNFLATSVFQARTLNAPCKIAPNWHLTPRFGEKCPLRKVTLEKETSFLFSLIFVCPIACMLCITSRVSYHSLQFHCNIANILTWNWSLINKFSKVPWSNDAHILY